jgi:hypothetical protein
MKNSKTVADLLAVANVCIKASEAWSRLLESQGKGTSRKKDDREINTTDRGDHKDWGDRGYRVKQSSEHKEKYYEIHHTTGHDLEERNTFLDRKKMSPPAAPVPQEPRWVNQRRVDFDIDKQMGEINVIFRGSMSIASKTQGWKLPREISLAQWIEPGRRMRWSDVGISFKPEDHPNTELSDRNLPFVVRIPIGRHKVAKTLINSGSSLNLMMRNTFIEMGLNLAKLTPCMTRFTRSSQGSCPLPSDAST